jgi:hypothetical protein
VISIDSSVTGVEDSSEQEYMNIGAGKSEVMDDSHEYMNFKVMTKR